MPTLAQLREEFTTLHTKAKATVDKATEDGRELTADEKTATETAFARMDVIATIEKQQAKLAGYNFNAGSGSVQKPTDPPGRDDVERVEGTPGGAPPKFDLAKPDDREAFGRALSTWAVSGELPRQFATITTTTQSGVLLPKKVARPIAPTAVNTFRQAHDLYNVQTFKTDDTAPVTLPVLDAASGGVISETTTTDTENPPVMTSSMTIGAQMYQSGSAWFSKLLLGANNFDMLAEVQPSLEYSKELGVESAIASAIVNDAGITQNVKTSNTAGAFGVPQMTQLNRSLAKRFDQLKVILLSQSAYTAAEGMVDSQGRPILTPDAQNQELKRYNGTPVLRCDYFQAVGTTGNVLGVLFSLLGFRLRDAGQPSIERYANIPTRAGQIGLNLLSAHGWGYVTAAVTKFVNL